MVAQHFLTGFSKKDYGAMKIAITKDIAPYENKIYPAKAPVDRQVINVLDNIAEAKGCLDPENADPLVTADIVGDLMPSNIHRTITQKLATWDTLPQLIEAQITKVLEASGFSLLSVNIVEEKPNPMQVEPTYQSRVKIRIKNNKTKVTQTIPFLIPTLMEGKFYINGGIRWHMPNIVATLPIFVVSPGKVQFRTNYSAAMFEYRSAPNKESIDILIGGTKMPFTIWLLQLKSLDEIGKYYGFTFSYFQGVPTKEDLSDSTKSFVKLPDDRYLVVTIDNQDNTRIIKSILINLNTLCKKLPSGYNFDFFNVDNATFIQAFLKVKKANLAYNFQKIITHLIDTRTADILKSRGIEPDLFLVSALCGNLSLHKVTEERLHVDNISIRLMDLIPTEIEKGLHYVLTEYKRRSIIEPDVLVKSNAGWVINSLRANAVLQSYKDGNLVIESSQYTSARLVGPGGFAKVEMVQVKDRGIVSSHFGALDPIDTSEGNPGIQLAFSTEFEYDPENNVFSTVKPTNTFKGILGAATSQIPFVNHDDGTRAQFGTQQNRQALPLVENEPPLVGTGMESYLCNYTSSYIAKRASRDGTVHYMDNNVIIIKHSDNSYERVDIMPSALQNSIGSYNGLTHTPIVKVGDKVKAHQHLVSNQFVKPVYSSGINALVCYQPHLGSTYEDGVVMSSSLTKRATSVHYDTIDVQLSSVQELNVFPFFQYKTKGHMKYEEGEVIIQLNLGAFGSFAQNEVIAPTSCEVVDIQIFPADESFIPLMREIDDTMYKQSNLALKSAGLAPVTNVNEKIDYIGKYEFRKTPLTRTLIRIKLIEYRDLRVGDKVNNRHGAKGIVTLIKPTEMMPRLPDGRHVDICFNPLGVLARQNIGQLMELHVGNVLDSLKRRLIQTSDTKAGIKLISTVYDLLDGFDDKRMSRTVISKLESMDAAEQAKVIDYYRKNGVRMIFPPFRSPKIENVEKAAAAVGSELQSKLYLPDLKRYTLHPVSWGVQYINKLAHISALKQNVRSIGRYIQTTLQPAKPGHHRNAIRIGEQDSWAFFGYPSGKELLRELFLVNTDNLAVKAKVISDIQENGDADIDESVYKNSHSGTNEAVKVNLTCAGLKLL
jgi:hypothetical protein